MFNSQQKSLVNFEQSESGFLGFFLRHKQNLKCFDTGFNRQIHYELNPKLFAIDEPYLMKAERDSLIKLKLDQDLTDSDDSSSKKKANLSNKRKKNLDKKLALLDGNFSSPEEKLMALGLIEKYLNKNSPIDLGKKANKKILLKSINLQESDSNPEAQSFVNSLFCNRFESLNYRAKLLCNPFSRAIKAKFGLSNFLIPPRCSFAGNDVVEGVKMLTRYLKLASIECKNESSSSIQSLICCKNPFVLIMDPAWDNNKSVKRKRSYETVSLDYMRRLCKETKILLDLISSLKSTTAKLSKNPNYNLTPIVCAIWTTNLDKEFVIDEMLPLLNMKLSYVLKWHKVTKIGLPVKVHGGQEYLILAEKYNENSSKNGNIKQDLQMNQDGSHHNGIIVSVPSAIHSHKPSIMPVIRRLFNFDDDGAQDNNLTLHCSTPDLHNPHMNSQSMSSSSTRHEDDSNNYWLVANEFINYLCGIELFARYLQTGFHSIGYECIKLQNEKLFSTIVE